MDPEKLSSLKARVYEKEDVINRAPESIPEISWDVYDRAITTPGLVDKLKAAYLKLQGEEEENAVKQTEEYLKNTSNTKDAKELIENAEKRVEKYQKIIDRMDKHLAREDKFRELVGDNHYLIDMVEFDKMFPTFLPRVSFMLQEDHISDANGTYEEQWEDRHEILVRAGYHDLRSICPRDPAMDLELHVDFFADLDKEEEETITIITPNEIVHNEQRELVEAYNYA